MKSVWQEKKIYLNKEIKMTIRIFGKKKASKRAKRPELRVVEGVDLRSRKRLWSHICKLRREMLITVDPDNKKALSVN